MRLGLIVDTDDRGFQQAQSLGLSFLEITYNVGRDVADFVNDLDNLKARCEKYGIAIGSIGRWGTDKLDENGELIKEEVEANLTLIDCAAELGCGVFNTGINYCDKLTLNENYQKAIEYFSILIERGKQKGVKICVYNCDWSNFVCSPEQWKIILGQLPDLGIKYDVSHCMNRGGDYLEEAARWGDRFGHVHIKGTLRVNGETHDDPPAGLDVTNWGAFFGMLYLHGYDGTLSIEPHSHTWRGELGDWGVKFTAEYIRQFIFKLDK